MVKLEDQTKKGREISCDGDALVLPVHFGILGVYPKCLKSLARVVLTTHWSQFTSPDVVCTKTPAHIPWAKVLRTQNTDHSSRAQVPCSQHICHSSRAKVPCSQHTVHNAPAQVPCSQHTGPHE
ncbi:hypothetical protein KIN20_034431, partial [Parelaphostrongylus tenuis]